jgi:hypothetical protein
MRLVNSLTESLIVKIWQYQLLDRTDLTTEEGEPIRIIYPGRINDDRGADLLDAVIITSQGLIKGDILPISRMEEKFLFWHYTNTRRIQLASGPTWHIPRLL